MTRASILLTLWVYRVEVNLFFTLGFLFGIQAKFRNTCVEIVGELPSPLVPAATNIWLRPVCKQYGHGDLPEYSTFAKCHIHTGSAAHWALHTVFCRPIFARSWLRFEGLLAHPILQKNLAHPCADLWGYATMQLGGIPWAWGGRTAHVPGLLPRNFIPPVSGT